MPVRAAAMWITSEFVERVSTQSVAWPFIHAGILRGAEISCFGKQTNVNSWSVGMDLLFRLGTRTRSKDFVKPDSA